MTSRGRSSTCAPTPRPSSPARTWSSTAARLSGRAVTMPEKPKVVTILTPCYNEAENVQALYERVRGVFEPLDEDYEHLFIDNASTDQTVEILRDIASRDRNV